MKQIGRKGKSSGSQNNLQNSSLDKQNEKMPISKQIEMQQNRFNQNQIKIETLKLRLRFLQEEKVRKQNKLEMIEGQIEKLKEKRSPNDNPILKQLKQHLKRIREELGGHFFQVEMEDDDVDVDQMTYEELLQLGQKIGKVSKGITPKQFDTLHKEVYKVQLGANQCSICRDEFEVDMECVKLKCNHLFHMECLRQWLDKEKVCPLCKTEVL